MFSKESDIYSYAIMVIQILSGNALIYDENVDDIEMFLNKIRIGDIKPNIPRKIPKDLKTLLDQCLNEQLDLRPSFNMIYTKLEEIISTLE